MRFFLLTFTMAVFLSCSTNEQTCNCESNFEWVKKTFEENDAGFKYIIDKKGQAAYNIHNQLMTEKIKTAKKMTECTELLRDWLKFFRSGHIGIELLVNETDVSSMTNENPHMEELNPKTLYLCIPSFMFKYKPAIDSLLTINRNKILKTENLIIDLRNNGGGSYVSHVNLREFFYTNPIRIIGAEFLSTTLNNQSFLDEANSDKHDFSEHYRQGLKRNYDILQSQLGKFVNLFDEDISIYKQNRVHEYPKNIGILTNEGCASATEQFLLEAKQGKKVKLFGVTTFGAYDISHTYSVESPCKEFKLWYSTSRNMCISELAIDEIGLQPDYYLDKSIPQYKWVEFVSEILNQ